MVAFIRHHQQLFHCFLYCFSCFLRHSDAAAAWDALMTTQATGAALVAVSQTREQVHELMRSYLERISLDVSPLTGKIIHIAGMLLALVRVSLNLAAKFLICWHCRHERQRLYIFHV